MSQKKEKDARTPQPVPTTPDRCEPVPMEDTKSGRRVKPCPEGYPETQPTDEPKQKQSGNPVPARSQGA